MGSNPKTSQGKKNHFTTKRENVCFRCRAKEHFSNIRVTPSHLCKWYKSSNKRATKRK